MEPVDTSAGRVIFSAIRDGQHFTFAAEEDHQIRYAAMVDVCIRLAFKPAPFADLVTWDLGGGITHIGIVVDRKSSQGRYMIEHNIGSGPRIEDVLFGWKM